MQFHIVSTDEFPLRIARENQDFPVLFIGPEGENIIRIDALPEVEVPMFPRTRLNVAMLEAMVTTWGDEVEGVEGHMWLVKGPRLMVGLAVCGEAPR